MPLTEDQRKLLEQAKAGLVVDRLENKEESPVLSWYARRCIRRQWYRYKDSGVASFQIYPITDLNRIETDYNEYCKRRRS